MRQRLTVSASLHLEIRPVSASTHDTEIMATHVMQAIMSSPSSTTALPAMGRNRTGSLGKALPALPSPTLTDPDMLLPTDKSDIPAVPSPPRNALYDRPPSPGYLREQTNTPVLREASSMGSLTIATQKKEKRGLMSRKMMLLRSRTASSTSQIPRSAPVEDINLSDHDSTYASSPTLMDVGNLLPESPAEERPRSSITEDASDDELAGMPQFLAKYDNNDVLPSDDELDDPCPAAQRYGYSVSIEGGLDEKRRKLEEDEQNSAILSKRAEAILANAKKRLNVSWQTCSQLARYSTNFSQLMEGNLRGARDLVAPLTTANLKRATSVSSSHVTPSSLYGNRSRPIYDGYHYETTPSRVPRKLQAQASSPTMGRDFYQGHARGFSATEIPERPYTAMERTNSPVRNVRRFPVKAQEPALAGSLRGSKSYDSLGSHIAGGAAQREFSGRRGSPDSNLEPLVEDDPSMHQANGDYRRQMDEQSESDYLGRPSSRTDGLREQMSSLRGRISSLKERAREDSLRRQSMQNLREPSPLNNASAAAPEFFYTSSPSYGSPVLDTNAGKGSKSHESSPIATQNPSKTWDAAPMFTGSRNAFADQTQEPQRYPSRNSRYARTSPDNMQRTSSRTEARQTLQAPTHDQTPSGTAFVQSSKRGYLHHQYNSSAEIPGAFDVPSPAESQDGRLLNGLGVTGLDDGADAQSETGASEYEDAASEQTSSVVAHEDREDAFDYEHFFLHSAMGTYGVGDRSSSPVSSVSASSAETARGPTAVPDDLNDYDEGKTYQPATPETPEKLREIEWNLHRRTMSQESISTLDTFATADEGLDSPEHDTPIAKPSTWPLPPLSRSAPSSRPSTAIPSRSHEHRSDSSSERADSGVGLATAGRLKHKHQKSAPAGILTPSPAQTSRTTMSPPMSPRQMQNPATVAVNALLEPQGRTLGLRDKALLFGVVEQLRVVCRRLQEGSDGDADVRLMQKRLEEAKRALDGAR